mgnify:FL=1
MAGNLYQMGRQDEEELGLEKLPMSLGEAIAEMEKDAFVLSVLGKEYSGSYLKVKKQEWRTYQQQVTPWEIEEYLYNV